MPEGQPHGLALASMLRMKQLTLPVIAIHVTVFAEAAIRVAATEIVFFPQPVDVPKLVEAVKAILATGGQLPPAGTG
jgi:hypothetical protein